jgi:hypothetical protein
MIGMRRYKSLRGGGGERGSGIVRTIESLISLDKAAVAGCEYFGNDIG